MSGYGKRIQHEDWSIAISTCKYRIRCSITCKYRKFIRRNFQRMWHAIKVGVSTPYRSLSIRTYTPGSMRNTAICRWLRPISTLISPAPARESHDLILILKLYEISRNIRPLLQSSSSSSSYSSQLH